jgi:catechol 2,3-dioxygenase-like lactoylglutathione lyase family enzyme
MVGNERAFSAVRKPCFQLSQEKTMTDPNFILKYVNDPAISADFYTKLLGRPPVESSPTFAMFALANGVMLGLWARRTVEPKPNDVGGTEMAFTVADAGAVNLMHAEWTRLGLEIIQTPQRMDFGDTFVATDPDGHRLRVFAPV